MGQKKKRGRLIVRNISYKANEDDLRKHFEKFGEITDIKLLKRPDGKLVGCGFIEFSTGDQAAKAIYGCSNKEFLNRTIYVDWAVCKDKYEKNFKSKNNCSDSTEIKEEQRENEEDKIKDDNEDIEMKDSDNEGIKMEDSENEDTSENDNDEDGSSDESYENKVKKIKVEKENDSVMKKKPLANDAEDGRTVFLKNIPFEANNDDLKKACKKFGPINYALINVEPISGHSKGTGFVKFKTKESADLLLNAADGFTLLDQIVAAYPALSRDNVKKKVESNKEKHSKDARNLYLVKEGLIMAGSKAAEGVSASDMAKRHKLEQIKAQILKNLNRFISRNRLSIHNLPLSYDDEKLKKMVIKYTNLKPHECRIMREKKPSIEFPNGKSKGFGFMSFKTHEDALFALRKLNNNPNVFGTKKRPIVAFSVEDKLVHNVKQKRIEKSRESNPTYKEKLKKLKEKKKNKKELIKNKSSELKLNFENEENKVNILNSEQNEKLESKNKSNEGNEDFVGVVSKSGQFVRMRSNKKIKEQSKEHAKNISKIKRLQKRKKLKRLNTTNEEKIIKNMKKIKNKKLNKKDNSNLIDKFEKLIDSKAYENTKSKKKSKWYS